MVCILIRRPRWTISRHRLACAPCHLSISFTCHTEAVGGGGRRLGWQMRGGEREGGGPPPRSQGPQLIHVRRSCCLGPVATATGRQASRPPSAAGGIRARAVARAGALSSMADAPLPPPFLARLRRGVRRVRSVAHPRPLSFPLWRARCGGVGGGARACAPYAYRGRPPRAGRRPPPRPPTSTRSGGGHRQRALCPASWRAARCAGVDAYGRPGGAALSHRCRHGAGAGGSAGRGCQGTSDLSRRRCGGVPLPPLFPSHMRFHLPLLPPPPFCCCIPPPPSCIPVPRSVLRGGP